MLSNKELEFINMIAKSDEQRDKLIQAKLEVNKKCEKNLEKEDRKVITMMRRIRGEKN